MILDGDSFPEYFYAQFLHGHLLFTGVVKVVIEGYVNTVDVVGRSKAVWSASVSATEAAADRLVVPSDSTRTYPSATTESTLNWFLELEVASDSKKKSPYDNF